MIRTSVTKRFTFEAAHKLPYHDGKCKRLHGHSYKLEITAGGPVQDVAEDNPESGMVVDFGKLSHIWKSVLEPNLDHKLIEDVYPTAENIARTIFNTFQSNLSLSDIELEQVRLWETETSYVTVRSS